MLIQNRLETVTYSIESNEHFKNAENITNKTHDANILIMSTDEVAGSKENLILDSNRLKFESEIERDIVHERCVRKELMENLSSTGK